MTEGYPIPQNERVSQAPAPLVSYIDAKIRHWEDLRTGWNGKVPKGYAGRMDTPQTVEEKLIPLQKVKQELSHGQYSEIASLVQTDLSQAEQKLTSYQQEMRPRSQDPDHEAMAGDTTFFRCQDSIIREQRILAKAGAVLDQDDKSYIANKIAEYKHKQTTGTERGKLMESINMQQTQVNTLKTLQQIVPKTPASK